MVSSPTVRFRCALATLGRFELWLGNRFVPTPPTQKARAIVAYTVARQGRDVARDQLLELFWSEFELERAREGLRTALSSIRHSLRDARCEPDGVIYADRSIVRWVTETDFDVGRFERLAGSSSTADKRLAIEAYEGDFLEGSFDDWVVRERDRLSSLYESVLAELTTRDQDVDAARLLLARNPFQEDAYAILIETHVRARRPAAAAELLAQYRAAARDGGLTPSIEFERRFADVPEVPALQRAVRGIEPVRDMKDAGRGESALPVSLTAFLGRDEEFAELKQLFRGSRFVTVVGPGGIGKTRLAIEAASALRFDFRDGVRFIDLSIIADSQYAASAIAAALGVFCASLDDAQSVLVSALRKRHMLLVLDNCEHLIPELAVVVSALLKDCPDAGILATAREPLKTAGEVVLRLGGLKEPDAIALFCERAHSANKQFVLNEDNVHVVEAICRQLDTMPLAIELAAPRVSAVSLKTLQRRLSEHVGAFSSDDVTAPVRHKTVRALLDWSYGLLNPHERSLLGIAGTFVGGFTLEAALAVARDVLPNDEIFDTLSSLVSKSLVVAETDAERERYSLLQTTQRYSLDRLEEGDWLDEARKRHREYFLSLARRADETHGSARAREWLQCYEPEIGNIRAAIESSVASGDALSGGELIAATRELWLETGLYAEGVHRAGGALRHIGEDAPPALRAGLWLVVAQLTNVLNPSAQSLEQAGLAAAAFQELGDEVHLAYALQTYGFALIRSGAYSHADSVLKRSQALAERLGNRRVVERALLRLGHCALVSGAYERALPCYEGALQIARSLGDELYAGYVLGHMANLYFFSRDIPKAISYGHAARNIFKKRGDRAKESNALVNLAECSLELGDLVGGAALAREGLEAARESENVRNAVQAIQHLAAIRAAQGRVRAAALLLGYVESALRQSTSAPELGDTLTRDRAMRELQAQLMSAQLEQLLAEGATLSEEEAFSLACATADGEEAPETP